MYAENSKKEKYVEVLKKVVHFYPDNREALIELAQYDIDNEKMEIAEKILFPLLEKNPKDDHVLYLLGALEEKKKNYEKAIEYLNHSIKYCSTEAAKEISKIFLVRLYLKTGSPPSVQKAEKLLDSVRVNKLENFTLTYRFYFLNIVLFLLTQNRGKLKHALSTALYVIKDSAINFSVSISEPGLSELLKKKLKPYDFECLIQIERMMLNETPVESFIKRFGDYIDPKMVKDIEAELQNAAVNIFKRIVDENMTEIDKIVTLCGSRLTFESLLYKIRTGFTKLTNHQQDQTVSLLTQTLEKLPKSYKWLVLDFCSQYLLDLNHNHQAALVNSLLSVLKEKKGSDEFLKETQSFLQTAKNTLDVTLKKKIKKDLIKIKNEGEK
jgi:tetratricopeptide (TPR) repeat protein